MDFVKTTWRLVQTAPASGAWNMAVDEAILESTGRGEVPPTLRLYAWMPPCLSMGYAQSFNDVDQEFLETMGWELVRRPTGGRAILHTDELTYSVTGPQTEARLAGSVLQSYQVLSQALLHTLHLLGIPAEAKEKPAIIPGSEESMPNDAGPDTAGQNPVCFEVPSNYEITVWGRKLVGSAQARRKEGVLQHGSLPLMGDLSRITRALKFDSEMARKQAASRLLERATTASTILGYPPSWEDAAQAFTRGFSEALNLVLEPAELTPAELKRASELAEEKYRHPRHTFRV